MTSSDLRPGFPDSVRPVFPEYVNELAQGESMTNRKWDYATIEETQPVQWNFPRPSEWEALLTPGGFVTFRPTVGNVPNWFHRQMQRLCFGIVWRRVK